MKLQLQSTLDFFKKFLLASLVSMSLVSGFASIFVTSIATIASAKPIPSPNRAPSAAIAAPKDDELLDIFMTINKIAIDTATLAQKHSKNKEVLALANFLIKEHTELNSLVAQFVKKTGLHPKADLTSKGLNNEANQSTKQLKTLEGKAFDQAYLDSALIFHEKAAAQMDENLLTNVKDNEIKVIFLKARPLLGLQIAKIKKAKMDLNK